jgi:hypothetical protein
VASQIITGSRVTVMGSDAVLELGAATEIQIEKALPFSTSDN